MKTLAAPRAVKVTEDRAIDSSLVSEILCCITFSGDLKRDEVMEYELSPYPSCLFELKNQLRKYEKAQLLDAIRSHTTSISDDAVIQSVPETENYVLYGGSLIYRLKWTEGSMGS